MIDRTCSVCGGFAQDVWVYVLNYEKDRYEISGCKKCIDGIEKKVKSVKNLNKKPIDKVLKEINFIKE
jgi:hypothetical protein